jgi:diguanylate cyclase (GGDEF)-like protein
MTRDGSLVEWNQAFEAARPDGDIQDLFAVLVPESHNSLRKDLQKKRAGKIARLEFLPQGEGGQAPYHGWLIPLPDGRVLLFAEPEDPDGGGQVERLSAELEETRARLKETERTLLARDVELKGVLAQVDEIVHIDPQTYLSNRKYIISELQKEVMRSDRYQSPLTISMLDIDHFKKVNDEYGHTVGDQALVHLADMLTESMRGTDKIGRYGGEEFLILLPNANLEAATLQAERLCKLVRGRPLEVSDVQIFVTISIGIAEFRPGKEDWQTLLSRADAALYQAKHAGRDRWVTSSG